MLKKKNIAMMMAVATVATTVAPAFAATQEVDEATLIAKVEEMLNTKYFDENEDGEGGTATEPYQNSVYKITVGGTDIKDIKDLKTAIANAKINDTKLTVDVVDKGHVKVDGRILAKEKTKYTRYTNDTLVEDAKAIVALPNVGKTVVYYNEQGAIVNDTDAVKAVVELASGKKVELVEGEYKVDITKAVDANGNAVNLTGISVEAGKSVVGFELLEEETAKEKEIPSKKLDSLVFNAKETEKVQLNLTDLYNEKGYTKSGVELVNTLIDANIAGNNEATIIENGKEYKIGFDKTKDLSTVKVNEAGNYELTVKIRYVENTSNNTLAKDGKDVKLVITGTSHKDLTQVATDMKIDNDQNKVEEGSDKYTSLEGENRFETAVEISKAGFLKLKEKAKGDKIQAGSVVLVGENAIVDGLAAAPLAKQKNAPILLAKKDSVPTETMNEIKRVLNKKQTIYIVGGENTISKEVEAQLIKEMDAKIVRLAGDDRYDTSLKIAKAMDKTTMTNAFVVGGEGEADAMSIAAVATKLTANETTAAPIIVSPEAGLTQDAKDFLYKNKTDITDVTVVGGTSKVSKQVIKDVKANVETSDTVERIAGADRKETNAMVINTYYGADALKKDVNDIFVAQDGYVGGNGKLVDALAVAPLAGRVEAPIVLATDNLSEEQETVIDTLTDKHTELKANKLTKVGGGVATAAVQSLLKILGLN